MINRIAFPDLGISLSVNRAAFRVFGMPIYWYGILIATGLILAVLYGIRECKKKNISSDDLFNMLLIALPVAIVCARVYYVAFQWEDYRGDFAEILNIRNGGLAIYGGVIGAALSVIGYCLKKKLSIGRVLDVLAVGLLIGQAIGRWGNFVNGEAFGSVTDLPWKMVIVQNGTTIADGVHPTFFYESLWNAIGIGVLLLYKRIQEFDGELFCAYLSWYGLGRLWIEGLRADSLYLGDIRISQLLAGLTLFAGLGLMISIRIRQGICRNEKK